MCNERNLGEKCILVGIESGGTIEPEQLDQIYRTFPNSGKQLYCVRVY